MHLQSNFFQTLDATSVVHPALELSHPYFLQSSSTDTHTETANILQAWIWSQQEQSRGSSRTSVKTIRVCYSLRRNEDGKVEARSSRSAGPVTRYPSPLFGLIAWHTTHPPPILIRPDLQVPVCDTFHAPPSSLEALRMISKGHPAVIKGMSKLNRSPRREASELARI